MSWVLNHLRTNEQQQKAGITSLDKGDASVDDGLGSGSYKTVSTVPSSAEPSPRAPFVSPSVDIPKLDGAQHEITALSDFDDAATQSFPTDNHAFPFQLQSLSRKWAHVIPSQTIIDFTSVEDVIVHQHGILTSIVNQGLDSFTHDQLQMAYEDARGAVGDAICQAATTVSATLAAAENAKPQSRQAYKEYAELHQRALMFLINMINELLERFDHEIPKLVKRARAGRLWPIEQMAIINQFVEMSRGPNYVPTSIAKLTQSLKPSSLVLFDIDDVQQKLVFTVMSVGFIILANAAQVSVQFTIRTIGIAQSAYVALLLTCAWPVYFITMLITRYRLGRPFKFTGVLIPRAIILGGLEASSAVFMALALHNMSLFNYQVIFASCHILMSSTIGRQLPASRIITMLVALCAPIFIIIDSIISTSSKPIDIAIVTIAIFSVVLSVIHRAAKTRLFPTEDEKTDIGMTFLESTAFSGLTAFIIIGAVLAVLDTQFHQMIVSFNVVNSSTRAPLIAASVLIAFHKTASDFIATQLDKDGSKRVSRSLLACSFVIVVLFATIFLRDKTSVLTITAAILTVIAACIDVKASPVDWKDHDHAPRVADNVWDAVATINEDENVNSDSV